MLAQCLVLSGVAALLQVTILSRAVYAQNETSRLTEWKADPKFLKSLAAPYKGQGFSVRPPSGYKLTKHPKADALKAAGANIVAWTKEEEHPSQFTLLFSVMVFPPLKRGQGNAQDFLNGYVKSMSERFPNLTTSKHRIGTVSGIPARRVTYHAVTEDETRLTGFVVVLIDEHTYVQIVGMVVNDESNELQELANAALTFQRTK